jgi:hypothetical protein
MEEAEGDSEFGSGKRPATSDGTALPAMKKRSLNTKKLKKQKSLGKLGFGLKSTISHPIPKTTPTSPARVALPVGAPVYRATTGFIEGESDDNLRTKVHSLESELSSLRAKLRWFEQSYGEIPTETLVGIKENSTTPKTGRRSVFREELGSLKSRDMGSEMSIGDQSILPRDVKALKGFKKDGEIDAIAEESDIDETNGKGIPPESTIKLIPPSPSTKSIASPPRPSRRSSPTKPCMSPPSSPTKSYCSPVSSPTKLNISPLSSPTKFQFSSSPIEDKPIDLLETLSPIHPNIMPALIPRQSRPDISLENMRNKLNDFAD